ncbi:MAG TPA: hypothetical protein DEB39_12345 [Planctomycetaceae bacterium]|nr:hypothetical protein [Planctomycetaceae bacterium]
MSYDLLFSGDTPGPEAILTSLDDISLQISELRVQIQNMERDISLLSVNLEKTKGFLGTVGNALETVRHQAGERFRLLSASKSAEDEMRDAVTTSFSDMFQAISRAFSTAQKLGIKLETGETKLEMNEKGNFVAEHPGETLPAEGESFVAVPVFEEPPMNVPAVEEPEVEEPEVEEPEVGASEVEAPGFEEPAVEEPAAGEISGSAVPGEEIAAEETSIEEPLISAPVLEEPVAAEDASPAPFAEDVRAEDVHAEATDAASVPAVEDISGAEGTTADGDEAVQAAIPTYPGFEAVIAPVPTESENEENEEYEDEDSAAVADLLKSITSSISTDLPETPVLPEPGLLDNAKLPDNGLADAAADLEKLLDQID